MSEIARVEQVALTTQRGLTADLYTRFVAFIDAKPKTTETYTRALRQLFSFFASSGITAPTREDIIAFREELKAAGRKPTTIQNYITATRLFFQWTEQERIYPNVAAHIKGAKLDSRHGGQYCPVDGNHRNNQRQERRQPAHLCAQPRGDAWQQPGNSLQTSHHGESVDLAGVIQNE